MESVYKLSKYSQKIDEACRTNQLNKVMEYNKHELAYINKLSKYFGNQKGGATVEQVVEAVKELVDVVVDDKNMEMNTFLQAIDNAVEGKILEIFGRVQLLTKGDILQKVGALKEQKDEQEATLQQVTDNFKQVNHEFKQQNTTRAQDLKQAQDDLAKAVAESLAKDKAQAELAQAKDQTSLIRELQDRLNKIGEENMKKISTIERESEERYKSYIKCDEELTKASEQVQALHQDLKTVREQVATESKAKEEAQAELAQAHQALADNLAKLETQRLAASSGL